jgi:endonuclease III
MEKIVEIGINRLNDLKREHIEFTKDVRADKLLNDIENNPHVFVLSCLMDRQIKAEKAWAIPQKIFDILQTHNIEDLANIDKNKYVNIFNENKLHRFNSDMADIFFNGVQDIKIKYHGNASEIWQGKPSSATVVYRFLEFNGCGVKIATMITNILARRFKIEFSDYYSIDISPDVHIKRVLSRMGFVKRDPSPELVIYKARELYPQFPGIIDFSCWEIGKKWCRPTAPDCYNCLVKSDCKKMI